MSGGEPEMLDTPDAPGKLYPGVKVSLIKAVIREMDASGSLKELLGPKPTDRLALVHKGKQFTFTPGRDVTLTGEQKKVFAAELKRVMSKHNRRRK